LGLWEKKGKFRRKEKEKRMGKRRGGLREFI
jgi:hypothetical protein